MIFYGQITREVVKINALRLYILVAFKVGDTARDRCHLREVIIIISRDSLQCGNISYRSVHLVSFQINYMVQHSATMVTLSMEEHLLLVEDP